MVEEISAYQEEYKFSVFNKMEFKYYPVKYEENSENRYVIMPVWILTQGGLFDTKKYVMVNAVDGEIIYVYNNVAVYTYENYKY